MGPEFFGVPRLLIIKTTSSRINRREDVLPRSVDDTNCPLMSGYHASFKFIMSLDFIAIQLTLHHLKHESAVSSYTKTTP
ncbi:hypothetical protein DAI22_11g202900 [Oryza sativa Japonica Group]|nr:hypothetical protein DAI22_11g202900 [Oryza sativa Japonica Group]